MRKLSALMTLGLVAAGCSHAPAANKAPGATVTTATSVLASPATTARTASGPSTTGAPVTTTTAAPLPATTHALGDKVALDSGDSVQVFAYNPNAIPSNSFSKPGPGMAFATVDAQGCAGSHPPAAGVVNPFFFTLQMTDRTQVQSSLPVTDPGLGVGPKTAGTCLRGLVTFEVPKAKPVAVVFHGSSPPIVAWAIP